MRRFCLMLSLSVISLSLVKAQTDVSAYIRSLALPVLDITTNDGEEPACDFVFAPEGEFGISIINNQTIPGRALLTENGQTVYDSGDYQKDSTGMTIRIRGNTSAYYSSKKPYKIKLEKKNDMLGRNDSNYYDKNWILIDSGGDELNTMIGLKVNEILGLGNWTPAYKFVNLFINNDYRGIYTLVESVKRNRDCRLNVDKQTGYIIERDPYWWNEDVYFSSDMNKKFTFKYPDSDDVTESQISYIQQVINSVEQAIADSTYPDYIDVHSFALWMLAHDILGTYDSGGANIYLTKYDNTADSKLCMSVLWDFGSIMKTADQWARIHYDSFFYFDKLFNNKNTVFKNQYSELWYQKSNDIFTQIDSFLNSFNDSEIAKSIELSRVYDSQRWNYEASTVSQNVQDAILWFTQRKQWINEQLKTNDINDVKSQSDNHNTVYTLNGTIVNKQTLMPGIYIKNGKKFIVRKSDFSAQR